jgi:4-aminobutyrate aminotransferase-like enzyme
MASSRSGAYPDNLTPMEQELLELAQKHLIRYASAFVPFVLRRAEGSRIWDQDGNNELV